MAHATAAIVVANAVPGASPTDELAGLPLLLRTLLSLQKAGVARAVVVCGDAASLERVLADRRLTIPVRVERGPWRDALGALGAPAIVARHDVVTEPSTYRALAECDVDGALAVAAARDGKRLGPFAVAPAFVDAFADGADAEPPEAATRLVEVPGAWSFRVDTPEGRRGAVTALFEACRKPVDGVVSRNLNRHVSIFLSKRLVSLPVTPNAVTLATFGVAVSAALSAAHGGYAFMLLGAFLLQCASIFDGIDGELARVRFQHSKTGQWLDTVCDDASNVLFYLGVAYGSRDLPLGRELAICGLIGAGATVLTCAQYYTELLRLGSGDFYAIEWDFDKTRPAGIKGAIVTFFKYTTKKDFFILMFLAFAVFGVLPYVLPIVAIGGLVTVGAATHRNVSRMLAAPASR